MLKPKVGDMVRLKPLLVESVSNDAPAYFSTKRPDNYSYHVYQDMIEEILPRPLVVGDRVSFMVGEQDCPSGVRGTIIAVSKSTFLWILRDDDCYETRDASSVRRVETEGRT